MQSAAANNLASRISIDSADKISLLNNTITQNNVTGIFVANISNYVLMTKNISYGHDYNYVGVLDDNIIESTYLDLPKLVGLKNVSIVN